MNVIYYFKLELDLASTEFVVLVLCLSGLDHVLSDLVREPLQDFSTFTVVDKEVHVAELVVEGHSFSKREHASFREKFFSNRGSI